MTDVLLVLNTGSSSLKFEVFGYEALDKFAKGKVTGIGTEARLSATVVASDVHVDRTLAANDHETAIGDRPHRPPRRRMAHAGDGTPDRAWRRRFHRACRRHARDSRSARGAGAPRAIAPALQSRGHRSVGPPVGRPDIACFDTAFDAGHAPLFQAFAVDATLRDQGIRRYGFHGLSYEWIARVLASEHPDLARSRVVVGHLGNGASLCALKDGASVDTTMGMTALDGLPMGSRTGAIDPGAVTYMLRNLGMGSDDVEHALYERSGLKGLSGLSNDVKTLLESTASRADFALDYFALKVAQFAAVMAVSMGGLDAVVFTGGVGENAGPVRDAILARLEFLRPFRTLIIPANEERMLAIHGKALLEAGRGG